MFNVVGVGAVFLLFLCTYCPRPYNVFHRLSPFFFAAVQSKAETELERYAYYAMGSVTPVYLVEIYW